MKICQHLVNFGPSLAKPLYMAMNSKKSQHMMPLISLFLVLFVLGCQRFQAGGNRYILPWPDTNGNYSLQPVTINTLTNPYKIQGSTAVMRLESRVTDGKLDGKEPDAKLSRNKNGDYIALDFATMQALTVYAHEEKLHEFDTRMGVGDLLPYPRSVGVDTTVRSAEGEGRLVNNALYFGPGDLLMIMPYAEAGLPIAVNAGVIAHEHFHALFQRLFLNDFFSKYSKIAAINCELHADTNNKDVVRPVVVRGQDDKPVTDDVSEIVRHNVLWVRALNEGLADLWAWLYTGNESFLVSSLADAGKQRVISNELQKIRPRYIPILHNTEQAYQMGSYTARFLRYFLTKYKSATTREAFASEMLKVISELKKFTLNQNLEKMISLNTVADIVSQSFTGDDKEFCKEVMASLVNAEPSVTTKRCNRYLKIEAKQ